MTVLQPLDKISDRSRRTLTEVSGLLVTETGRTAYLNAAVASQAAPVADGVHVHSPGEPGIWRNMWCRMWLRERQSRGGHRRPSR
jgi:hypothetical protein